MAYVNLGQVIYPVGAIFASTSSTSPSSMFGGTWSQIGGDSCLMACDNSVGAYGSSKKITINNMPSHNHPFTNLLGCGWEGNSSENDRLGYSRYKAGRNLSQFGQSSYQGGGRIICLTPTDATCGDALPSSALRACFASAEDVPHKEELYRGDSSCVTSKTSKSKLVQALKQFVHSQLEQYINLLVQQVQPASMAEDGHLLQMVDSLDHKGLGIILAERIHINSLLRKCQAIITYHLQEIIRPLLLQLVKELQGRASVLVLDMYEITLVIQAVMPRTTMFPHIEHVTAGIELPNILGGVLC